MGQLEAHGKQHEKNILLMLKSSHNRISGELETAEKEHNKIKDSIRASEGLVSKLETMDRLKVELPKLRTGNAQMNLILTSLSRKINDLQEELIDLRKAREQLQKEHSEIIIKRNEIVNLRSKIMPEAKLRELKTKLTRDSAGLKNISKEFDRLKNDVPLLIEKKESLKEELDQTVKQIPLVLKQVTSMKERIDRLAPKVTSEDEVKDLEEKVRVLGPKKENLTEENREISPKIVSITEEEEKLSSIFDAYKSKNKKDEAKLSDLEKTRREMDITEDKLAKLRDDMSSLQGECEGKKENVEKLKKKYSELLNTNQTYKATIKEVEEGTEQLKEIMGK